MPRVRVCRRVPVRAAEGARPGATPSGKPGEELPNIPDPVALGPAPSLGSPQTLAETERILIMQALERSGWNHSRTAESLGIGRTTLWRKLKEYGIDK